MLRRSAWGLAGILAVCASVQAGELDAWKSNVKISQVAPGERHTIHSYYVANPESPDGQWVVFFSSTTLDAQLGEVVIRHRTSGDEKVLAKDVSTEDAHRVACQQWLSGGKRVAYHDLRGDESSVVLVNVASGEKKIIAPGRQVGFGQGSADLLPVYAPHWNPGGQRDAQILNVVTGEIVATIPADGVREQFKTKVEREFQDKPISIYFPVLSPDLSKAFFKLATPLGGDFRSKQGSHRQCLGWYDLKEQKLEVLLEKWGHPAWHPDSRQIIEVQPNLIATKNGESKRIPNAPYFSGTHPSVSPSGNLFITDWAMEKKTGVPGEWGIVVGDIKTGEYVLIDKFPHNRGARSWRRSHPHPHFSDDGQRIYYNVADGPWNRLVVAELGAVSAK